MRVVFLDIDGVLNHSAHYTSLAPRLGHTTPVDWIDRTCVARLDALCERTGAAVVVSSSWRIYLRDKGGAAPVLAAAGLRAPVIGETPDHTTETDRETVIAGRWGEIRAWLDAHPEVTGYVVLDDCEVTAPTARFVRTSIAVGLTDEDCERAAMALGLTP